MFCLQVNLFFSWVVQQLPTSFPPRCWIRLGYDWSASHGKDGKPEKKNAVSRSERVRVLASLGNPKLTSCFLLAPITSSLSVSMFNLLVVLAASPGTLCQLSDFQLDLLMFVATGLGPMVSIKDLRVSTRGELSLGLMLLLLGSQILVIIST